MLEGTAFLPELSAIVGGQGNAFLAILAYILTQVLAAYSVMAVLRVREEDLLTRTELMLSRPVSRKEYLAGHLFFAFTGSAAALSLFSFCSGDFQSGISRLPAVWVVTSFAVLAYGWLPRAASGISWGIVGGLLLLELLWEIRVISTGVFQISPFSWVYPGVTVSAVSMLIMTAVSVSFVCLGLYGFSRRDII